MNNSLVVESLDIRQLSDEELASRLKEYGFPLGPIVDSTRAVYQRKLAKLLRNEEEQQQSAEDGDATGDDEEKERQEINTSSSFQYTSIYDISSSYSPYRIDELKRRPLSRDPARNWESTYSSPTTIPASTITSHSSKPKKVAIPFTYKVVGVICLLLFVFVIYHNMESSGVNPVPPSMDD